MITSISPGKVFEGEIVYANKKLGFRLVFEIVEAENFECQSSIHTEGFGFLLDISKSSNGKMNLNPTNTLSLLWTDGKSQFNAEYDFNSETIKGKFIPCVDVNCDFAGVFTLNVKS